ncbi:hypothetical protein [Butyricimonas faecalis]|nr:hypothetical protein [Butyricimonas faecalis]
MARIVSTLPSCYPPRYALPLSTENHEIPDNPKRVKREFKEK